MKQKSPGPYVVVFLLLVLLFLGFFVPGGLILSTENFLPFKYEPHKYAIGISCIILGLITLIISVKFLIWGMRRMASNLDILFVNLTLKGENHAKDGRHYFGDMEGRRVDIYCKPVRNRRYFGDVKTVRYVGHALDIYVEGSFHTRSSIGLVREGEGIHEKIRVYMIKYLTAKFIDNFGGEIFKMDDPRFQELEIYAMDRNWTQGFLKNEEVSGSLVFLLGEDIKCIRQHVHITPKAVHFTTLTNIRYLKASDIKTIVDNVLRISTAGESLAKAAVTSEETETERGVRVGRG
jgi:hypothetical protein